MTMNQEIPNEVLKDVSIERAHTDEQVHVGRVIHILLKLSNNQEKSSSDEEIQTSTC